MLCNKYKYIPQDFAVYFASEDFTHQEQNSILCNMFQNHNAEILFSYRSDFVKFKFAVYELLIKYDSDERTLTEAELIMKEVRISKIIPEDAETYFIGVYFKLIKLQLMYSGKSYRKIKLRTLLHDFGYKRRTAVLLNEITNTLKSLSMYACLRNFAPCDIASVGINDMIIIRLID